MYGGSAFALVDTPYPPDLQAAARAGTLPPVDYTNQNPSYASAAGGAISTADDLGTWLQALVGGRVFGADLQRQWLDSPRPAEPASAPSATQYGLGIERQILAPGVPLYFHFGEMPGYNDFAGYDPVNQVTIVIWSNLTVGLTGRRPRTPCWARSPARSTSCRRQNRRRRPPRADEPRLPATARRPKGHLLGALRGATVSQPDAEIVQRCQGMTPLVDALAHTRLRTTARGRRSAARSRRVASRLAQIT
jgi:CubicO group peptidase (beta-lactamase class C family)